ncbi:hypothetical protein BLGI_1473 [Brevibacillus laterosporus GI-9]|nr:hypothetical protein BLGI_1473 [Brevibacillus laterosporus GI-9]
MNVPLKETGEQRLIGFLLFYLFAQYQVVRPVGMGQTGI